jgi:hypothetical protein
MSFCFRFYQPPTVLVKQEKTSITILVFKTNIRSIRDILTVDETISCLDGLKRWNVDGDDIDNVLRIETTRPDPANIIGLVREAGFFCEELPD